MSSSENQQAINPKCLNCPTVELYRRIIDRDREYQSKITDITMTDFDQTTSIKLSQSTQETAIRMIDLTSQYIESNEDRIIAKTNHCHGPIKIKPSLLKRLLGHQEDSRCSLSFQEQAEMAPVGLYNRQISSIRKKAIKEIKEK